MPMIQESGIRRVIRDAGDTFPVDEAVLLREFGVCRVDSLRRELPQWGDCEDLALRMLGLDRYNSGGIAAAEDVLERVVDNLHVNCLRSHVTQRLDTFSGLLRRGEVPELVETESLGRHDLLAYRDTASPGAMLHYAVCLNPDPPLVISRWGIGKEIFIHPRDVLPLKYGENMTYFSVSDGANGRPLPIEGYAPLFSTQLEMALAHYPRSD